MELGRGSGAPVTAGFAPTTLPYGVFSAADGRRRVGVAVGTDVIDLSALDLPHREVLSMPSLNAFMALGPRAWRETRGALLALLSGLGNEAGLDPHRLPVTDVALHLPFEVADYVDFYASEQHASNVGRLFRPGQEPLPRNWRHVPIGYHGRSGTVVVSGTPVVRPHGQHLDPGSDLPIFGPTQRLDFEAEVGFVVGVATVPGDSVPVERFTEHVFGLVLVNDWSARDIQAWESAPLGPFLGKSFATSVSPWVVPLDALAGARVAAPARDQELLPYLVEPEPWGLDIALEVRLNGHVIARPPYSEMAWTPAQQLAHLTVNGAALRTGDLYASGTVSGESPAQLGSMLEMTHNGARPLTLPGGGRRMFLEDGDEVVISATAPGEEGEPIWLGEVTGRVEPAR